MVVFCRIRDAMLVERECRRRWVAAGRYPTTQIALPVGMPGALPRLAMT